MKYQILITDTGEHYLCDESESLLVSMARLGRRGIPVGCRGGGCGVCKVEVVDGEYQAQVMSRAHVSEEEFEAGQVLACRIHPRSALSVRVIGGLRKAACRPRAEAGAITTVAE